MTTYNVGMSLERTRPPEYSEGIEVSAKDEAEAFLKALRVYEKKHSKLLKSGEYKVVFDFAARSDGMLE